MKKILSLILSFAFVIPAFAALSDWKLHPIFDEEVTHVVETPAYVYFTSRRMMENNSQEIYFSLFRYDKSGDELIALSPYNLLSGHSVRDVIYNPAKGYLAVLYKDYDIDLLYNDGKVVNIPYYAQSSPIYSKGVNSMSIDAKNDRLYLATDFGYVAINDNKNEVAESRLYGEPLEAFCRIGDNLLAIKGEELLKIDASSPRLSLDQYETIGTFDEPGLLYPLDNTKFLLVGGPKDNRYIKILSLGNDGIEELGSYNTGYIYNLENTSSGVTATTGDKIYLFENSGSVKELQRHDSFKNSAAATTNMSEVWNGLKRKGLSSVKKTGENWSMTRNWMLPNAPATYATTSFASHPTKGFLMLDYGMGPTTINMYSYSPLQLSAYQNGRWTNFAPAYTNQDRTTMVTASNGIAVDPSNSNYVYITSYHNGLVRLNLDNPQDIIHLSHSSDGDRHNSGFLELPFFPQTNKGYFNLSEPRFDSKGNLWVAFADYDDTADPNPHYLCWLSSDLKATTSSTNIRMPKHVEFDVYAPIQNFTVSIPLLTTGNGVHVASGYDNDTGTLFVLNTNGTPDDMSDDRAYKFPGFTDSDGNTMDLGRIRYLWEDPETGYVWVLFTTGVCYFQPSQAMSGNYILYRPKVARNDGTNLADYLLDGVSVNHMTTDAEGRKWFATNGAGVICTTSDGREILEEFNVSNSPLPDDIVYGIGYNSETNSLIFSTDQGYAEYTLPANQDTSNKTDIKAYPNPVRPEYSGYVTITDIPQGSFVKITDVAGNLVKDLGIMSGFEILWDISDSNFNRVKSGVYHIMVSPSDSSTSFKGVGKILVIS